MSPINPNGSHPSPDDPIIGMRDARTALCLPCYLDGDVEIDRLQAQTWRRSMGSFWCDHHEGFAEPPAAGDAVHGYMEEKWRVTCVLCAVEANPFHALGPHDAHRTCASCKGNLGAEHRKLRRLMQMVDERIESVLKSIRNNLILGGL